MAQHEKIVVVQVDYCFLKYKDGDPMMTVLTMIDDAYHWINAVVCEST